MLIMLMLSVVHLGLLRLPPQRAGSDTISFFFSFSFLLPLLLLHVSESSLHVAKRNLNYTSHHVYTTLRSQV